MFTKFNDANCWGAVTKRWKHPKPAKTSHNQPKPCVGLCDICVDGRLWCCVTITLTIDQIRVSWYGMCKEEPGKNISSALFVCFTRMRAQDIHQSLLVQLFNILLWRQVDRIWHDNPILELPREIYSWYWLDISMSCENISAGLFSAREHALTFRESFNAKFTIMPRKFHAW